MTNKLKYFVGNWKMFGDFGSFKIANKINKFTNKQKSLKNFKVVLCPPNILINYFKTTEIITNVYCSKITIMIY